MQSNILQYRISIALFHHLPATVQIVWNAFRAHIENKSCHTWNLCRWYWLLHCCSKCDCYGDAPTDINHRKLAIFRQSFRVQQVLSRHQTTLTSSFTNSSGFPLQNPIVSEWSLLGTGGEKLTSAPSAYSPRLLTHLRGTTTLSVVANQECRLIGGRSQSCSCVSITLTHSRSNPHRHIHAQGL